MTAGKRLQIFVITCYESVSNFSEFVNISVSTLNKFFSDKLFPDLTGLIKLKSTGLSIDWLVDGCGSMYARNETGETLRLSNSSEDKRPYSKPAERIRHWIISNYFSLEDYAETFDSNYDELHDIIFGDALPSTPFIKMLRETGCNIGWVYTGEGSQYENNSAGMILKLRQEGVKALTGSPEEVQVHDFRLLDVKTPEDLYKIIRIAIRAELQERDKRNEFSY